MRKAQWFVLAAWLGAAGAVGAMAAGPAWAHHEVYAYDLDHPVVVDGVVREFVWANPHVMLYLEVPDPRAGEDEWTLEGVAVPVLVRSGWTRESLRPGDHVQVLLAPRRDAQHSGRILRVTTNDGRVLSIGPRRGGR